jgi:hypothetical protein
MINIKKIIIFTFLLLITSISILYRINYMENKNKQMIVDMDNNLKNFNKTYKPTCNDIKLVKQYNSMVMHYDIRVTRFNYLHPNNQIKITSFDQIKCD